MVEKRIAAMVYNPTKLNLAKVRAIVNAEQASAGWATTLWFATSVADPGQDATRRAVEAGASMIIAAGGDGTIRAVVEALDGRPEGAAQIPLAIIPVGTGNQLARNLTYALEDVPAAVRTAFRGAERSIDLVRIEIRREDSSVDRHVFIVMAGLGLDAKMFANTNSELKKKIGYNAYVLGFFAALRDRNRLKMRYRMDDKTARNANANSILVGNCGSLRGNLNLMPAARIDDGKLDMVVMQPDSVIGWAQIVFKLFWENGVLNRSRAGRKLMTPDVAALRYATGRQLSVRLSRPEEIQLDGDGFGKATAFRATIVPGGITLKTHP